MIGVIVNWNCIFTCLLPLQVTVRIGKMGRRILGFGC